MNDEVFSCKTEDIKVALANLNPEKVKTRVIIRVETKKNNWMERIMNVREAKLLFRNPISQGIFAKNAMAALKTA